MILILSRQDDGSTAFIAQWLLYLKKKFIRINGDTDRMQFKSLDMDRKELIVEQNDQKYNLFEISSFWYRRRGVSMKNLKINKKGIEDYVFEDHKTYHKNHIKEELKVLIEYIHSIVESTSTKTIGNHETISVNKLKVLTQARSCGLQIPPTYVITNKKDLEAIMIEANSGVITKALSQGVYFFTKKKHYYSYTEKLDTEELKKLPDHFFPSLIQLEIKKKYELRIFYFKGEFYTMAIFSQSDENTKVDFRKQNEEESPHRKVPYRLPKDVEDKLTALAKRLNIDTGSFDIIVDEDDNYIFLEVNPVGQFSMTSFPCNYYLEKKIAAYL